MPLKSIRHTLKVARHMGLKVADLMKWIGNKLTAVDLIQLFVSSLLAFHYRNCFSKVANIRYGCWVENGSERR